VTQVTIHDSMTGQERVLEPRDPGKVGIYACGPTVYAPIHVGNARPYVVFSLFKRFLTTLGYDVTFVANVTDVNDKIYDKAREAGVPSGQLAAEMTDRYVQDTERLGIGRPDAEPKAASTVDGIIDLIADLIEGGHAYAAGGDVYFRVASFPEYGKLSHRDLGEMIQPEGDDAASGLKEAPQDFALWKAHKPGEDTHWSAPWGDGRPGWHIECSAMAEEILGVDFDVHGGGNDLVFPHHENEIAQTEAARGRPLARIWMHNGMLQFVGEKMSKSEGNIRSLSGALDEHGRDALLMYFVGGHYRQPIAYSDGELEQAAAGVARVRELGRRLDPDAGAPADLEALYERFQEALARDFNTPQARAVVFEWVAEANRRLDAGESFGAGKLREMLWVFGLDNLLDADAEAIPEEASVLLEQRNAARADKDWARADEIRDRLATLGFDVRDSADGAKLVRRTGNG
jgi:cysteinyl-tRNA synthetase